MSEEKQEEVVAESQEEEESMSVEELYGMYLQKHERALEGLSLTAMEILGRLSELEAKVARTEG
jgi:hypothetical protein